jgi:VanZ family protein
VRGIAIMRQLKKGRESNVLMVLAWLFTAAWMLVIFMLSAQPGTKSGNLSMGITQVLVRVIGFVFPLDPVISANPDWLYNLDGIIRECAHGAAYFILALLGATALKSCGLRGRLKLVLMTLAFCAVYAVSDEIHQLFVPGRACELFDFEVDMLGAVCGLAIMQLVTFLAVRSRHRAMIRVSSVNNKKLLTKKAANK